MKNFLYQGTHFVDRKIKAYRNKTTNIVQPRIRQTKVYFKASLVLLHFFPKISQEIQKAAN